ncbi:phage tail family protein [Gehongia tenuis]|uniref:Phage tail family protein n=1 Tax=Gehongia tenuis TaxID=2763655 RepID=A0A926D5E0_9FIRM|nr:phage tail family protein [Gehongia tenuis]MBC8531757.1 phage tail family protein [Gehongia tenuis]
MRLDERLIYRSATGAEIEFSALGVFHAAEVTGLNALPNTIHGTQNVGQDGRSVTGSTLESRNITISGYIRTNSVQDANRLLQVCNPKHEGTLRYHSDYYDVWIGCYLEAVPTIAEPTDGAALISYFVSLLCPDPYWRDETSAYSEIATWVPVWHWDLIFPEEGTIFEFREPSLITNVVNPGHVPTGMTIVFRALGPVENPSITNVKTQEYIKVNQSMMEGDVLTVKTGYGQQTAVLVTSGVTINVFNALDYDGNVDMQLSVGDNLIRYNADEGIEMLNVTIYHDYLYTGVF